MKDFLVKGHDEAVYSAQISAETWEEAMAIYRNGHAGYTYEGRGVGMVADECEEVESELEEDEYAGLTPEEARDKALQDLLDMEW